MFEGTDSVFNTESDRWNISGKSFKTYNLPMQIKIPIHCDH